MTEDLTDDPGNRVKQGSRERLVRSSVCQGREKGRKQPGVLRRLLPKVPGIMLSMMVIFFLVSFRSPFPFPSIESGEARSLRDGTRWRRRDP